MVGKIELQACPRDYHQSVESFKQLDPRLERQYKNLEKLYIEAGFSGMENFGGNQTVAHTLQNKNFVYEAKKSFEDIGSPKPEGFIVHGLVRESSLNGYSPNDDEIADKFFKKVASMGNSVRIFSGANDFEALKRQIRLAKKYKLHVQVDISIQNIEYNKDRLMEFSCQCVDEGVDQLNYKSHSGNSNMKVLAELTEQMDEILPKKIKLGFHTHCTYGNAYNEIQTFVDAIGSDRGVVIHTGPGKDMCDGFAQPDPNKIIEMFPDKVVYNSDGLEKLNEATVKLNRQLTAVGLGNKDLKDVLRGVYKHKYSGEALEQHVNMVSDLFKNANIPGGGALYTVNDIKGAKCIGEQAKGNFEKRDYLVDYLKTAIEFHKYDGSPDDVTPFYFNREQSTKFFLNNFYTSKSFDANVDIVSLVKPENIKLDKKGKILQNQILGVYGRMPNKPDASLVKRALMERIEEVAENHGQIIDQEGMEKYITIGEEINKMYLSNKRRQLIIENVDKLTENYSNAQSEDEKKYYMIRAQHLQERLDNHKDSHDITLRDANYAEFLKSGKIDDFTKSN
jgi:pyruvate/oxaloacetate carboxyltransferase